MAVAAAMGSRGVSQLLILSQVVLSLALSFTVIPLLYFTSRRKYMGALVNPLYVSVIAWAIGIFIAGLNMYVLIYGIRRGTLWDDSE